MGNADTGAARDPWMRRADAPVLVGATAGVGPVVIPAVVDGGGHGPGLSRCRKHRQH